MRTELRSRQQTLADATRLSSVERQSSGEVGGFPDSRAGGEAEDTQTDRAERQAGRAAQDQQRTEHCWRGGAIRWSCCVGKACRSRPSLRHGDAARPACPTGRPAGAKRAPPAWGRGRIAEQSAASCSRGLWCNGTEKWFRENSKRCTFSGVSSSHLQGAVQGFEPKWAIWKSVNVSTVSLSHLAYKNERHRPGSQSRMFFT
jgi:hypothetical protein